MPNKYEIIETFLKIAPIVFVAVTLKVITTYKKRKITLISFLISYTTGLGVTFLLNDLIEGYLSGTWYVASIGSIAILSEKLMEYFVFNFKIGDYINKLLDIFIDKIKNIVK